MASPLLFGRGRTGAQPGAEGVHIGRVKLARVCRLPGHEAIAGRQIDRRDRLGEIAAHVCLGQGQAEAEAGEEDAG